MQGHEEQGTDARVQQRRSMWGWAAVITAVLAVLIYAAVVGGSGASDGAGARTACHDAVERRLKSPGTAEYSGEQLDHAGDRWTLTGSVDSQNSFGGVVRNDFICVTVGSDDNWSIVSLTGLVN